MEAKELMVLSVDELVEKGRLLRKESFNLRFQKVTGHFESPHRLHEIRRDIARVLTVLRMKKTT